ncbi:hypothetical protein [Cedecea sp. MMO-103]|uniref:hypothetical protein n=1 Tax=Cedecea sp. MMO-103 TaxID=3081238 RepID=UPI0030168B69
MAKTAAERKAAQRSRRLAGGERRIDLPLDAQELEMLTQNCAARRPGKAPYDAAEYIALLIRQDNARLNGLIKSISAESCGKCGDQIPVNTCPCAGDSQCWVTAGWHVLKLKP